MLSREIDGKRFRVIIVNLSEIECLEVIAYDKPRNKLERLFIHFKDLLQYALELDFEISSDQGMTKILSR